MFCANCRLCSLHSMADGTMPGIMNRNMQQGNRLAKPLNIQRLEASLDLQPFLTYAQELISRPLSSSEDSDIEDDSEVISPGDKILNGIYTSKCGKSKTSSSGCICDLLILYLFFVLHFQTDKMINCKSTICRKWDRTVSGCRIFYSAIRKPRVKYPMKTNTYAKCCVIM